MIGYVPSPIGWSWGRGFRQDTAQLIVWYEVHQPQAARVNL